MQSAPAQSAAGQISQNEDIRYLGRLLGDVIRAWGGVALFERIEAIRSASVDRYRGVVRTDVSGYDPATLDLDVVVCYSCCLGNPVPAIDEPCG